MTRVRQPACIAVVIVTALLCLHAPMHGQQWRKIVIDAGMLGPVMPRVADIDGDGDMDVAVSDYQTGEVLWYENAGNHVLWTRHLIKDSTYVPMGVGIADFNGDAKPDVAVAGYFDPALAWYENNLPDEDWPRDILLHREDGADGASWIDVGDIDGDGDNDILLSAHKTGDLRWFENDGGTPIMWMGRPVPAAAGIAGGQIALRDMDGDGDLDVIAALQSRNTLVWLESRRRGSQWYAHTIDRMLPGARTVRVGDIDDDGDIDVVAGGTRGQAVVRYENVGHGSIAWIKRVVDSTLDVPGTVGMLEADGGASREVVATSFNEGIVVWYRRVGNTWHREYIDGDLKWARGLCTADIDGDGNDELVVAAQGAPGSLVYYRNDERNPRISRPPAALDFGKVLVDSTVQETLSIANTGEGILDIGKLDIMGSGAVDFHVDDPGPFRLDPGERMTRVISCTPLEPGVKKKQLRIRSSDRFSSVLYVNLIVEGVTYRTPQISIFPAVLDFGDSKVDSTVRKTLRIKNLGSGELSITSLAVHGTEPVPFQLDDAGSLRLDARESASIDVHCTPTNTGEKRDTLVIRSSDPASPHEQVPLIVNGVLGLHPRISVEPASLHFGRLQRDSTAERTFTIANRGDAPLLITAMRITGTVPCPFCFEDAAPFSIDPGDTRDFTVTCTPTETGMSARPLQILCSDPACPELFVNLFVDGLTDIPQSPAPRTLRMEQNFPNPFNPTTEITYELPAFGMARLSVHDLLGREVRMLLREPQPAGTYQLHFDATGLPSGVYVYRLQWSGQAVTRKMVLLR